MIFGSKFTKLQSPKQIFPSKINEKYRSHVCGVIGIPPSLFNTVVQLSFYNVARVKCRPRVFHDWSHWSHIRFFILSFFHRFSFASQWTVGQKIKYDHDIRTYGSSRPRQNGTEAEKRDFNRFIWFYDDIDDVDRHVDVVDEARSPIWRRGIMSAREEMQFLFDSRVSASQHQLT